MKPFNRLSLKVSSFLLSALAITGMAACGFDTPTSSSEAPASSHVHSSESSSSSESHEHSSEVHSSSSSESSHSESEHSHSSSEHSHSSESEHSHSSESEHSHSSESEHSHSSSSEHTHEYVRTVTKEPTCTENGLAVYTCKADGDTYSEVINALGHNYGSWILVKDATCTEKGQEKRVCSRDASHVETRDIALKAHTPGSPVKENEKAATCVEKASYDEVVYCSVCHAEISRTHVVGEDEGVHVFGEWTLVKAPTCTEKGQEKRVCQTDSSHVEYRDVAAKGHTPAEAVKENEKAATCLAKASYDEVVYCTVCHAEISRTTVTVGALGDHDFGEWVTIKEPTCTQKGQEKRVCKTDENHVEIRDIGLKPHTYVPTIYAPTCTEAGYTKYVCSACDANYTVDGDGALDHNWTSITVVPATCTEDGYIDYECDRCHLTKKETLKAEGHKIKDTLINPDCTNQGYTLHECENEGCDYSYKDTYTAALGHLTEGKATCENDLVCKRCSAVVEKATGHNYVAGTPVPATCTEDGYTVYTCSNCSDSYQSDKVTASGHNYVAGTPVARTCTEKGYTVYTCSNCSDSYQSDFVAEAGHTYVSTLVSEGYAKDGECDYVYTYEKECSVCKAKTTVEEHKDVHIYKTVIVTEATCSQDGVKKEVCSRCGEDKENSEFTYSDANAHTWDAGANIDGVTTIYTCTGCSETKTVISYADKTNASVGKTDLGSTNTVELKEATLELDATTLAALDEIAGDNVDLSVNRLSDGDKEALSITDEQRQQIGDSPIYDFSLVVNETTVSTFNGGKITITLPYELSAGEDPDNIIVWYINDLGEVEEVNAQYSGGFVSFETDHFSYYTVAKMTPAQRCEKYGHNTFTYTTPATCGEEGFETTVCLRCGETISKEILSALGHNYVAGDSKAASCGVTGYTEYECSRCHDTYKITVDALKHNYQKVDEKAATCTEQGYVKYECSNCHATYTNRLTAKGHAYGEWTVVTDATCTEVGQEKRVCASDENHVEYREIAAKGHDYNATKVDPTCESAGYTEYECVACHDSYRADYVAALGHDYVATFTWAEDYSSATVIFVCANDKTHVIEDVEVTVSSRISQVSCIDPSAAVYTATAILNGETYTDTKSDIAIPATGHDWFWIETVAPTCTESGYEKFECARCGETRKDILPALGHDYVDGVCTRCSEHEYECDHTKFHEEVLDLSKYGSCSHPFTYLACECGEVKILTDQYGFSAAVICGNKMSNNWEQGQPVQDGNTSYMTMRGVCPDCGLIITMLQGQTLIDECHRLQFVELGFAMGEETIIEGLHWEEVYGYHNKTTRTDITPEDICEGTKIYAYICDICGEIASNPTYDLHCNLTFEETTVETPAGYIKTSVATCPDCGYTFEMVEKVNLMYDGCVEIIMKTETLYKPNGEVFATYNYNNSKDHHEYREKYELLGETCEDGLVYTRYCPKCGYEYSYVTYSHHTNSSQILLDKECYSQIWHYECTICGKQWEDSFNDNCRWYQISSEEVYDEEGKLLGTSTVYFCSSCGAKKTVFDGGIVTDEEGNRYFVMKTTYEYKDPAFTYVNEQNAPIISEVGEYVIDFPTTYYFCPSVSGYYNIYSHCPYGDPELYICTLDGKQVAYDDDSGSNMNFNLSVALTEGVIYRFDFRRNVKECPVTISVTEITELKAGQELSASSKDAPETFQYMFNGDAERRYVIYFIPSEGAEIAVNLIGNGKDEFTTSSTSWQYLDGGIAYSIVVTFNKNGSCQFGIFDITDLKDEYTNSQEKIDECHTTYYYGIDWYDPKTEEIVFSLRGVWTGETHSTTRQYELLGETCNDGWRYYDVCTVCGEITNQSSYTNYGHNYEYYSGNFYGVSYSYDECRICGQRRASSLSVYDDLDWQLVSEEDGLSYYVCSDRLLEKYVAVSTEEGEDGWISVQTSVTYQLIKTDESFAYETETFVKALANPGELNWEVTASGEYDLLITPEESGYYFIAVYAENMSWSANGVNPEGNQFSFENNIYFDFFEAGQTWKVRFFAEAEKVDPKSSPRAIIAFQHLNATVVEPNQTYTVNSNDEFFIINVAEGENMYLFLQRGKAESSGDGYAAPVMKEGCIYFIDTDVKDTWTVDGSRRYTALGGNNVGRFYGMAGYTFSAYHWSELRLETTEEVGEPDPEHPCVYPVYMTQVVYHGEDIVYQTEWTSERNEHEVTTRYEFYNGVDCEGGYMVISHCEKCGEEWMSDSGWGHNSEKIVLADFGEEGMCGGYAYTYRCTICGHQEGTEINCYCDFSYVSRDDNGVYFYRCSKCGATKRSWDIASEKDENCYMEVEHHEEYYNAEGVTVYQYTNVWTDNRHNMQADFSKIEMFGESCEDGFRIFFVCADCGYSYDSVYYGHSTFTYDVIDLTQYGASEGARLTLYRCPCGERSSYDLDLPGCDMSEENIKPWWSGEEYNYGYAYQYTCVVSEPEICGFTYQYGRYSKQEGCYRVYFNALRFGYDEETDSWAATFTFSDGKERNHPYNYPESTTTDEEGNRVEQNGGVCPVCGTYYRNTYVYDQDGNKLSYAYRSCDYLTGEETNDYEKFIQVGDYRVRSESYYSYKYGSSDWKWTLTTYSYPNPKDPCHYEYFQENSDGNEGSGNGYQHLNTYWRIIEQPTCTQPGVEAYCCDACGEVINTYPVNAYGHDYYYDEYRDLYVCCRCGIESVVNGNGSIGFEDLTLKYGDGENYVIGYYQYEEGTYLRYVSLVRHEVGEEEDEEIFFGDLPIYDYPMDNDGHAVYFSKTDIEAFAAKNDLAKGEYDVRFYMVPHGADLILDYSITLTEEETEISSFGYHVFTIMPESEKTIDVVDFEQWDYINISYVSTFYIDMYINLELADGGTAQYNANWDSYIDLGAYKAEDHAVTSISLLLSTVNCSEVVQPLVVLVKLQQY